MEIDNHPSSINSFLLPSLFIGAPSIDKEHDELVRQLDTLLSQPDALLGSESFSEILSQLGGQINAHFANEETLFKSFGMPADEIASHVQAHTLILDPYSHLNHDLMQGRALNRTDVLLMIKDWIIGHVVSFDLNIKKYLPTTAQYGV